MKPNTIISNDETRLKDIKQEFKEFIIDKKHPCIMANAVFSLNNFEMKLFKKSKFPNSSYLARYGLYLPSYYNLNNKQIDYISSVVNNILK